MFANFTEETCTGTGATLALAGVTTGNIPFSESFADGDPVAYVVEDSGGTIKVAGVGAYVSATDDITRDDTWNWNGTVIDDNPSTNITLSGGTHTVRCDVIDDDLNSGGVTSGRIYLSPIFQEISGTMAASSTARIYYVPLKINQAGFYDAFSFQVTASGTNVRCGLYSSKDGLPDILMAVHDTSFSVGTTGTKSASFDGGSIFLRKGNYYLAVHNDNSVSFRGSNSDSICSSQLGQSAIDGIIAMAFKVRAYGAMPDPADITSLSYTASGLIMGVDAT